MAIRKISNLYNYNANRAQTKVKMHLANIQPRAKPLIFCGLMLITSLFSATNVHGCEKIEPEIKIINEYGNDIFLYNYLYDQNDKLVKTLRNSGLTNFVASVTERNLPKFQKLAKCEEKLEVKLFFVYRPVYLREEKDRVPPFQLKKIDSNNIANIRYLNSPWVELAIKSSPKPFVHAVFFWNERQLLLDQAILSEIDRPPRLPATYQPSTEFPLLPLNPYTFRDKYLSDYLNSFLLPQLAKSPSSCGFVPYLPPISEDPPLDLQGSAQKAIAKRIPPDILWLFHNTRQFNCYPFVILVDGALNRNIYLATVEYTKLVNAIVDNFLTSANSDISYKNVLDLKDIFILKNYRIEPLYP